MVTSKNTTFVPYPVVSLASTVKHYPLAAFPYSSIWSANLTDKSGCRLFLWNTAIDWSISICTDPLLSNFSLQYNPWIRLKSHCNKGNDHQLKKLLNVKNKFSLLAPLEMHKKNNMEKPMLRYIGLKLVHGYKVLWTNLYSNKYFPSNQMTDSSSLHFFSYNVTLKIKLSTLWRV